MGDFNDSADVFTLPLRGALAEPLMIEVVREITQDDLKDLINAPKTDVPVLQKFRSIHHRQAALVAEGKTNNEVAAIVGSTAQRIVQLKNDPAFMELVGYYQDQIITAQLEDSARIRDKLVDVSEMALNEISDRLEDPARRNVLPTSELRQIAQMGLDRTVAPPKSTVNNVSQPQVITLDFGGKGFRNLDKPEKPAMIDITPNDQTKPSTEAKE